ncbi:glycosyltransferase [Paracoccus sp. MBLB3053]|uniref:Glycosyltransferase n=1 Tax=Paracoccus aurantius TaxID=3073814 RepID=A0ABU2HWK1_9RHOB|nr:glycosyltransferase [Paracoccus sp. MBLB3053]MDS9468935.1 glycosyltransferase [Paracoccus sp. MBLB3053]
MRDNSETSFDANSVSTTPSSPSETARQSDGESAPTVLVYYGDTLSSASNGSQVRTLGLLAFLCGRYDDVVLYRYGESAGNGWPAEETAALTSRFPQLRLVSDPDGIGLRLFDKLKKFVVLSWPGLARHAYRWAIPGRAPNFAAIRDRNSNMLYVVNYVDSLARLNGIDENRTVVETHDLRYFRRVKGTSASLISWKHLLNLRYEIAALASVRALVAITGNEAYFYRNMLPSSKVYYVPDYQPVDAIPHSPEERLDYDLLFAGSGNVINRDGLLRLFESHGPRLRSLRIALCGLICDRPEIRELATLNPNLILLGFLSAEELENTYARSRACLSPTHGTGLNIKLVEALRHRKPVFASDDSRAGLTAGYERCVFPLDPDLMTSLLRDPGRLQAASEAAANYYHHFSRTGDLPALGEALDQILSADCRPEG